jgi:DNA polymerase III gamma/tau subunit
LIARQGKGSFRDTLGILEKVFSTIKENNINKEQVENIFGIVNEKEIFTILESVCEKDINKLLTHFENLNLETSQSIEAAYVETVKMMEHALFLRLIKEEEIKKIFDKKIGEDMIKKLRELSIKYGSIVSSSNLYKLLQIEKDLNTNNVEIKKTILIAGLIRIIEE